MIKVKNRKIENNQPEFIRLMQKWTFSLKSHYWLLMWEWKGIGLGRGEKLIILNYILYENLHYLQYVQNSNLFTEKTNDKISRKVQKTQILGHFGPEFAQKNFFSKIGLVTFCTLPFCIIVQKIRKNKWQNFKKSPKNPNFRPFWAQICPKIFFFKNRALSHFVHCHFASLCKKSEKNKWQNFEKSPKNPNFRPFWA